MGHFRPIWENRVAVRYFVYYIYKPGGYCVMKIIDENHEMPETLLTFLQ